MKLETMCRSQEFCVCCYYYGGENGVPLTYYCNTEICSNPEKNCLFVQNGGKRDGK